MSRTGRAQGDRLSLAEARRLALGAQGFDRPRPRTRVTPARVRQTVRRLGLLQIDYVNVLAPAQYQVLFSRLGPYDRKLLDRLLFRERTLVEQWAHEASILPVEDLPFVRHRMETGDRRSRAFAGFLRKHRRYADLVLARVRREGPLAAENVPEPNGERGRRKGSWWGWTTAKATLEGLFVEGRLAIANRRTAGFAREYDLAERVFPGEFLAQRVERGEAQRELLRRAARAHGVGTAADLADYYRIPIREARARIAELVEAGELRSVQIEGWREIAYRPPRVRVPRAIEAASLLSPFDPVIWYRPRTARLFGFDYRIEIYVPKPKRRYGYYVLPFLLGERLAGRVDLKADRQAGVLRVPAAHRESGVDARTIVEPLAGELRAMAGWLGLEGVQVEPRGNLARALAPALRS